MTDFELTENQKRILATAYDNHSSGVNAGISGTDLQDVDMADVAQLQILGLMQWHPPDRRMLLIPTVTGRQVASAFPAVPVEGDPAEPAQIEE